MNNYQILDDLTSGVQVISKDMRYLYLNKALLKEVASDSEGIVGYKMTEKFPGIERTQIYQEICRSLATQTPGVFTNEFTFPDGRTAYYEIAIEIIPEGVMLFSKDITATTKGTSLLRETNKRLEQFAHIVAHDMREPVRRVAILAEELILEHAQNLPEAGQSLCQDIQQQTNYLMKIISDFRYLSGIGGQKQEPEPTDIVALAKEVAAQIRSTHPDIALEFRFPPEPRKVMAYKSMLTILLRNLMENAMIHGTGTLELTIHEARDATGQSCPTFALSNAILDEELVEDIFLPFVKTLERNTGLGLAIAQKVVDHHDGKIWSQQDGQKFTVFFTLQPPTA